MLEGGAITESETEAEREGERERRREGEGEGEGKPTRIGGIACSISSDAVSGQAS